MTIRQLRNYIDGRFEDGASTFDKHSPVDGQRIAQVHEASRDQVNRAVAAAHRALPAWAGLSVAARTDHLLALADGITRRFDDFLQAEIGDTGIPLGLILGILAVLLGAYSLVLDFDFIQKGVQQRVDKKYAWTGAFGIMVTVIWLYLEILRMLAISRD